MVRIEWGACTSLSFGFFFFMQCIYWDGYEKTPAETYNSMTTKFIQTNVIVSTYIHPRIPFFSSDRASFSFALRPLRCITFFSIRQKDNKILERNNKNEVSIRTSPPYFFFVVFRWDFLESYAFQMNSLILWTNWNFLYSESRLWLLVRRKKMWCFLQLFVASLLMVKVDPDLMIPRIYTITYTKAPQQIFLPAVI